MCPKDPSTTDFGAEYLQTRTWLAANCSARKSIEDNRMCFAATASFGIALSAGKLHVLTGTANTSSTSAELRGAIVLALSAAAERPVIILIDSSNVQRRVEQLIQG